MCFSVTVWAMSHSAATTVAKAKFGNGIGFFIAWRGQEKAA